MSTVTELTTLAATLQVSCHRNSEICSNGISVNIQAKPHMPVDIKIKTIQNRMKIEYGVHLSTKFKAFFYSHMIGNFPILLINKPAAAHPNANKSSKIIPFSSVVNSNLSMQT